MPLPAGKDDPRQTPAMRQYFSFKQQHPACILLFRMGDFYEMFDDDALLAHKVLGVTLTQRTEGVPMAGVPHHAVEGYLRRLIRAGYRVAVCDQVENPAQAKGIVKRDVTRVVTPGTLTDEALLDEGKENPLAAVLFHGGGGSEGKSQKGAFDNPEQGNRNAELVSLAWAELSTGSFRIATLGADVLADELARIGPREILYVETANRHPPPRVQALVDALHCAATPRPVWQFRQNEAIETLTRQYQVATLAGFGLSHDDLALGPAAAIVRYLIETQCVGQEEKEGVGEETTSSPGTSPGTSPEMGRVSVNSQALLPHLQPPKHWDRADHLIIDQTSLRSLEVEQTIRSGSIEGSLLGTLRDCKTAMGKRTLRQWLCFPLCKKDAIVERQRVVGALVEDSRFLDELGRLLQQVQDVERILGRVGIGRATPRDVVALGTSCARAGQLTQLLADRPAVAAQAARLAAVAPPLGELAAGIARACRESPPGHLREGGLFRDGYDAQLDEYRGLQRDSHIWLAGYQKQLIEETGIPSLKVGFNKVFGFYIELTAANKDRAPAAWSRKQTLKNAERFITAQLKEYEEKVLSAEQRALAREQELFIQLCARVQEHLEALRQYAAAAAELDVLGCFARRAVRRRYVKPEIVDEPVLVIRAGRHPVLDEILGDRFVPNDVELGRQGPDSSSAWREDAQTEATQNAERETRNSTLALITGPNMAGKSTYIRQAALLALLAHAGSFVPAEAATVGRVDRIFTRIGASDELHAGQSTFMVEMTETANICHHAGPRSLVILDEIGRGTSTLDGLSLAWAIAEHLAVRGCRTLFATHYHEITALAQEFPNVANLHVTVREWGDQIVFLHRVIPGATDRSYGIHVAKIAGLPDSVVQRAGQLLGQLAVNHNPAPLTHGNSNAVSASGPAGTQLPLFKEYLENPAWEKLRKVNLNNLSPLESFDLLRQILNDFSSPDARI